MTKHSHEEYLNWLDAEIGKRKYLFATIGSRSAEVPEVLVEYHDIGVASLLANRAVLVRHARDENYPDKCRCCIGSIDNGTPLVTMISFPCYTYTDVTDSLDEVMG